MHPNDALVLAEADSIAVVNVGTGSWRLRDGSGDWRHVEISAVDRRDDPAVEGFVVTMRDVDERIALEERLRAQAYHDSLTGLGNRALLAERTEQALAERRDDGNGATVGMLFIDLDDFQAINDGYGHPVGDEVLRLVAKRILQVLGPLEVAARVGGDEFAVLLERVDSVEAAAAAANRIGAVLREPLHSAIGEVVLETSIGVAVARREDATLDTLLRDADAALHVSKADATRVEIYDPARDPNAPERAALAGELRRGIAGHELEVHYQPKVDMGTGHVTAMEALVRWRHPESGLLPPIAFLELAERSGQMAALTHRVLELSLTGLAEVHRQGHDLIVCVNLAAGSLRDPGFVDDVQAMLEHTGVPADRLRLELTEDVLMSDATRAEPTLRALNEMGITFSVDDFGTGHSSLTRLKSMPIDVLKIDRSFVMDMMEDENDSAIVRSTIGLAHDLGLLVVAEGVEDAATWQELRLFGCDTAQGFHIARPLPLAGFTRWIDEWRWTRDRALAGGDGGKRVTAEEAMDLTRTWFGDLFVQSPVAMTLAGLDGRYLRVNRSFCELLRRSEAELLTKTFTDVSHSDGATDSAELRDRLLAGGEPAGSLEKRYVRGDGSLIWVEVNVALVRDAEGRPLLFFSQSQDISARKLAEVQAAQLADVVSATDEAIYSVALDGTMTSWNDGAERLYGYTAFEAVGHSSGMLIPQHPSAFAAGLKQVERGQTLRIETTAIRRDGRPVRVGFSARPLEDESGAIVGASVVAREVQTWQGMFGLDAAGRVTFANPMVTALLGWDPEELIGRPMHELIHHSHADGSHYPLAECPNYACLQDGETRRRSDEVFWRADGTSLPVAYSSTPIVQAGAVTGVVCVFEPYMVGAARHPHGPSGAGRAGS
jgi:diguanylate cyclase (GGDEF)-like protein/PAS domain S-box-containing protein